MTFSLLTLAIQLEEDVVSVRQRTREIARVLGFDVQQQTRLATAVSEIARNAFSYAGSGKAEFSLGGNTTPQLFSIRISDNGGGIANIEQILQGEYRSSTGMGLGIVGAQRLMDQFQIDSTPGKGTTVVLGKLLPRRMPLITEQSFPELRNRILQQQPKSVLDEFRAQNQELMRTMDELRRRQDELTALNRELEDTNRGVVALYAELDEKANHLRRADEMKSRFLSNMSHEFRTPLNSILALSRLLLDRTDGELSGEQEIQVSYIRKSAESLAELVNDLLDIAKVEAGKIDIRAADFEVANLFGALRGMLKPLLVGNSLLLTFEASPGIPAIYSDEAKVSQILRNFISNSLKFTEAGEISVSAEMESAGDFVKFSVKDTGIGIAPEHREHVFQEFTQLDSYLQRKVKGTGLGLPLSRKLAELLGGNVCVESELGLGSTFLLRIPIVFASREPAVTKPEVLNDIDPTRDYVLLVEDHYETQIAYEKHLRNRNWHTVSARSVREAEAILRQLTPVAIILDIRLQGEDAWNLLAHLKSGRDTRNIPVIVATTLDDRAKALALGADEFLMKPVDSTVLRNAIEKLARRTRRTILIVDDQETSRYLERQLFSNKNVRFTEANDGLQAFEKLRLDRPDLVIMDLSMPEMNGFKLVEALKADAELCGIPVVVSTSAKLSPEEAAFLVPRTLAILSKDKLLDPETASALDSALTLAGLSDLTSSEATREVA